MGQRKELDVRTFGATGNGVTDDTAAFNAAIAAARVMGGGVVFVPAGRYRLTAQLYLTSRVQLRGIFDTHQDLQNSSKNETIDVDAINTSVLIIDHGYESGTTAPALSTITTASAIAFAGVSPSLVGLVVMYANQMRPYRYWAAVTSGAGYGPLQFRVHPTGGTPDPTKVIRVQAASGNNGIWELDRIAPGATSPYYSGASITFPPPGAGAEIQDGDLVWKSVQVNGSYSQARLPKVYPPTLWADAPRADGTIPNETIYNKHNLIDCEIRNCLFLNSYELCRFDRKNNLTVIENCWWSAFRRGWFLDNASGIPRMSRMHGTNLINIAFGEPDDSNAGQTTETATWISANLEAYVFGYLDWIRAYDLFIHRSKYGFYFPPGVEGINGSACRGIFIACGAEVSSVSACRVEATNATEGLQFYAPTFAAESGSAAALHIAGGDANNPTPYVRIHHGVFAGAGALRHVWHQDGILHLSHVQFAAPSANGNVVVTANAESLHMDHCEFDGTGVGLSIVTAWGGKAFLVANDLKSTTYTPPATLPTIYRAVANVGIADGTNG